MLFPGAALQTAMDITLAPGALALCQDGFACHDPAGREGIFDFIAIPTVVRADDARVYMTDRGVVHGAALETIVSPLGLYQAGVSLLLLPDGGHYRAGWMHSAACPAYRRCQMG